MRQLNSLTLALAALPCCIIVVGCSNSNERIIGTWRNVHSGNNTITFIGDGTALFTDDSKIHTVHWELAEKDNKLLFTPDLFGRDSSTMFDFKLEFKLGGTELELVEKRSKFSNRYVRVYDLKSSDLAGIWKTNLDESEVYIEIIPTNTPTSFKVLQKYGDSTAEYSGTLVGSMLNCKISPKETDEMCEKQFNIIPTSRREFTGCKGWAFKKQ